MTLFNIDIAAGNLTQAQITHIANVTYGLGLGAYNEAVYVAAIREHVDSLIEDEKEDIAEVDNHPPASKKRGELAKSVAAIRQLHESGHSVRNIARLVGGSPAGVHKILKNME